MRSEHRLKTTRLQRPVWLHVFHQRHHLRDHKVSHGAVHLHSAVNRPSIAHRTTRLSTISMAFRMLTTTHTFTTIPTALDHILNQTLVIFPLPRAKTSAARYTTRRTAPTVHKALHLLIRVQYLRSAKRSSHARASFPRIRAAIAWFCARLRRRLNSHPLKRTARSLEESTVH